MISLEGGLRLPYLDLQCRSAAERKLLVTDIPKGSEVKLSHTTMRVLKCFMEQPRAELSGADITKATKVFTGSLYPILLRLEAAGWLSSHWEDIDPKEAGRPRRRYYRLTMLGQRLANEAFNELGLVAGKSSLARGKLAWSI